MKSDSKLQHDVMAELEGEPLVDASRIGVAARDGVVALSGFVKSQAQKIAAEKAARRVSGVRAIAEAIEVRHESDSKSRDCEIARRILDAFALDTMIPTEKVEVKVEHGRVSLTGTVDWYYQRDAVRKTLAKISGVTAVSDLLDVRNQRVRQGTDNGGDQAFGEC